MGTRDTIKNVQSYLSWILIVDHDSRPVTTAFREFVRDCWLRAYPAEANRVLWREEINAGQMLFGHTSYVPNIQLYFELIGKMHVYLFKNDQLEFLTWYFHVLYPLVFLGGVTVRQISDSRPSTDLLPTLHDSTLCLGFKVSAYISSPCFQLARPRH